ADTTQMVDRMRKGPTSLIQMGASAQKVPIFAVRDEGLYQRIQRWKALESEAKRAGQLYSRSVGGSSATVGFQAVWEQFKNDMTDRSSVAESLVYSMIRDMANVELETIKKNLSRIQIVEAEVIQQLALSDRVLKDSGKKLDVRNSASVSTSKDTLRFPYDGEIWFDELSNYKVNLKGGCQARNGASL
ncbi:MAG: hypothetical protein KDD25_01860, partial [Bdellovibrionales bacterium]|nr:hypothetical protein [Bdellovibrionales bacterium]